MDISIAHCNNIASLNLSLRSHELTVLFGPNGAGKSTVARAIAAQAGIRAGELKGMVPYGSADTPSVAGLPAGCQLMVFDEDYVDETLFQDDDHLIADGYHVFVETPEYKKALEETRTRFESARERLEDEGDLTNLIEILQDLLSCYGKAKTGYAKSSPIAKGVAKSGDLIDHVPNALGQYTPLIQSDNAREWIAWRGKGKGFESARVCPYCAGRWTPEDAAVGQQLQDAYGNKYFDHRTTVLAAFGKANKYLGSDTSGKVDALLATPLTTGLPESAASLLKVIRTEVEALLDQLWKIKALGFESLRNIDRIKNYVAGLRIDADDFHHINSDEVVGRIRAVNAVLDDLVARITDIAKAIGIQKSQLKRALDDSKKDMDGFLEAAGFPYELFIAADDGSSCVVALKPRGLADSVHAPKKRLSYGERNALALALFAAQMQRNRPDLVVLDDPISSFDQNKKYAIIQHLFARKDGACSGLTALLLTHDPESLAMVMKVHADKLCPSQVLFLRNDAGAASALEVKPADMESIIVWLRAQADGCSDLPSRIACTRQLLELEGKKGNAWSYLSCLVHRKPAPDVAEGAGSYRDMTAAEISDAQGVLVDLGFAETDYGALLAQLSNAELLKRASKGVGAREKVCAFRILSSSDHGALKAAAYRAGVNGTVFEFASEYFHVENLLAYTLDPGRFSTAPASVLVAIDAAMVEYGRAVGIACGQGA